MQRFTRVIFAALVAATSFAAHAQQEPAPAAQGEIRIMPLTSAADALDAQVMARQALSAEQARNLLDTRMTLAVNAWKAKDDSSCFVWVGATATPAAGKVVRMPQSLHWAMSEAGKGDQGAAVCNRAFQAALQIAANGDNLTLKKLQADAAATAYPKKPRFLKLERSRGTVSHRTAGTLNDAGRQLIADTLGPRWHTVLDHRKYAAHIVLMTGKTVEGRSFCLAEYGVVAIPPEGVTWKLPATMGARWKVVQDKNSTEDCTRAAVMPALAALRDGYPEMLDGVGPEEGTTYPAVAALKKQVASYDAKQAKLRPAAASSTTRHTTSLRCTNECFNGNCVRTFENGRKERWQAPRVYNPFKQNWEWDTTTNACGK